MPDRLIVARELGQLLSVLAHPNRIRIIEELRREERDVHFLQHALNISQSGVSQHLGVLRAHRLVIERREGRHVFYRLRQPALAAWILDGLQFLEGEREALEQFHVAAERARALWPDASPTQ